jgi:predicted dehydrogenase
MIPLAIVGCGSIGERHVSAATRSSMFRLVALCDPSLSRLECCISEQQPHPLLLSHHEDTLRAHPRAVAICTPHRMHAPMAAFFLRHGIHVLVEKPLALTSADCAILTRLSSSCIHASLSVVQQRRFLPHFGIIREAYRSGALGDLIHAESSVLWSRDAGYYSQSDWRGHRRSEGGIFFTIAIHFLDILGYCATLPSRCLTCFVRRIRHHHEIDDSGTATFELPSGGFFSQSWSTCAHPNGQVGNLRLLFERCTISIEGKFLESMRILGGERNAIRCLRRVPNTLKTPNPNLHSDVYEAFADKISSRAADPRLCSPEEGSQVVRLMEEAYAAAGWPPLEPDLSSLSCEPAVLRQRSERLESRLLQSS